MATPSTPASSIILSPSISTFIPLNQPISIKLDDSNFLSWQSQVLPAIHGHRLFRFIHNPAPPPSHITDAAGASLPNPAYEDWYCQDQLLLSWIRASLSDSLVAQLVSSATSADLWASILAFFAESSPAKIDHLHKTLQSITKSNLTCKEYIRKVKSIFDELAFLGSPLSEAEKVRYTLAGLGSDFNPLRVALSTQPGPLTLRDLNAFLLTTEPLLMPSPTTSFLPSSSQPTAFYTSPNPYPFPTRNPTPSRTNFTPRAPGPRFSFPPNRSYFPPPRPSVTRPNLPPLLPNPTFPNSNQTTTGQPTMPINFIQPTSHRVL